MNRGMSCAADFSERNPHLVERVRWGLEVGTRCSYISGPDDVFVRVTEHDHNQHGTPEEQARNAKCLELLGKHYPAPDDADDDMVKSMMVRAIFELEQAKQNGEAIK